MYDLSSLKSGPEVVETIVQGIRMRYPEPGVSMSLGLGTRAIHSGTGILSRRIVSFAVSKSSLLEGLRR